MGWTEDTGLHEGYLLPETPEGPQQHAPGDRITGWRVHCECNTANSWSPVDHWTSKLLTRVPSPALEDLQADQIYATDQQATYIDDERDDVHAAVQRIWHTDHLDIPAAIDGITIARRTVDRATADLDRAVAAARAAGASWDAIGRAAGISRQSAHQRWNTPVPGVSQLAPDH